jgi:glycosyltransferase involved in cell wall biosynthesis
MLGKNNINHKIPIIQTMHGWGTNKNKQHENMDVAILNMVNRVVSVSKSDKKLLISKGVHSENIITIYNGIADIIYNDNLVASITCDLIKRRNSDKVIIGCIGSVCKRKNQKMLIEALKYMKEDDVEIIFLGEGEDINELENLANSYNVLDKVKFYGYVDKAYLYIKYFDYIILPSLSEGLPLTILESFREGKPVIVSNINVFTEIINQDKNGLVFDVSNTDEFVKAVRKAIIIKNSDKYINMSRACKEDFESKYRIIDMYNKYMNEYLNLRS